MNVISCTILIVDDSPEDRELYRRYLRCDPNYSYTILEASLGQQGLDLWQQQQPDVVLLDYSLPDLDGLEFLAQMHTPNCQSCLPVIIVTGLGNEAIAVQALKSGAQDYLVKGAITPEVLYLAVNGAFSTVRLHIQLQQRNDRERFVLQITQKIYQFLNLEEILQPTVDELRKFIQTDRVLIFQLQPDGNGTVIAESVGAEWRSLLNLSIYDPCLAENCVRFSRSKSVNHDVLFVNDYIKRYRQGQVTVIPNIHASDIDPCHVELLTQFQVQANLVVPILHNDYFWGLLIAHHCAEPRSWQALEIDLLKELAIQFGIALRQADLYQQAQDKLTERNQAEAELRVSEERLRLALQASSMGTWDWNIQTGKIIWSDNLEALFGLEPGGFDGSLEMFRSLLHPDDREKVLTAIDRAITIGEDYNLEFRTVNPQGEVRWTLTQGRVIYDLNGQPVRMAGIDLDITKRKRDVEALQESEARFRQLAENIDAVFWITEMPTNRVSYVSPAYERLWGLNPQAIYTNQKAWVDYIHPDDQEWVNRAFATKAATGQFDEEYRIVLDDGRICWVHDRCFPLKNEAGEIYKFAGIAQDITSRKQIEVALRSQADELNNTNILLMQSTALVNQRNQELNQFTHIVSHDLKAPLRAISNLSQWIEEDLADQVPPDIKQKLNLLRSRISRMENMINGLLTYARAGYEEVPDETFSLEALLIEIIDSLDVPSKFTVQVPSNLPILTTKRLLLSQVLTNLISNGIKHHDRLDGRIQVTIQVQDQYCKFSVSDDGPGISSEQHNLIFNIFRTLTSKDRKDSTGVGLAIIKKIIERIGGQIYLKSELGQGTTFYFTWPIS